MEMQRAHSRALPSVPYLPAATFMTNGGTLASSATLGHRARQSLGAAPMASES
jgi:hypothetical protein